MLHFFSAKFLRDLEMIVLLIDLVVYCFVILPNFPPEFNLKFEFFRLIIFLRSSWNFEAWLWDDLYVVFDCFLVFEDLWALLNRFISRFQGTFEFFVSFNELSKICRKFNLIPKWLFVYFKKFSKIFWVKPAFSINLEYFWWFFKWF